MNTLIKRELHQLVDKCNDQDLLEEAKIFLQAGKDTGDWWDELTEEDQNMVMESEASYEKGDFISHDELMEQFTAKKNL
jgi:hypothetical protein